MEYWRGGVMEENNFFNSQYNWRTSDGQACSPQASHSGQCTVLQICTRMSQTNFQYALLTSLYN